MVGVFTECSLDIEGQSTGKDITDNRLRFVKGISFCYLGDQLLQSQGSCAQLYLVSYMYGTSFPGEARQHLTNHKVCRIPPPPYALPKLVLQRRAQFLGFV